LVVAVSAILVILMATAVGLSTHGAKRTGSQPVEAGSPPISALPGRETPSQEQWEQLLPTLEKNVAASPDDVNALRKLALAYYNLGRFADAARIYEKLLALKEDAVLRDRLGNTLRDAGDLAAAESAYRKAMADDPALASPYLNLAELLWRQGKDAEALRVLDEGLQTVPESSRAALEKAREVITTEQGGPPS
jgi:tetratricopeptide (TPR) repeat protein